MQEEHALNISKNIWDRLALTDIMLSDPRSESKKNMSNATTNSNLNAKLHCRVYFKGKLLAWWGSLNNI
jgi:hypothetical protein